jgi:flagellar hook assembly protein FlgD
VAWDGLDDTGHVVGDGIYSVRLGPRDLAGNIGLGRTTEAAVYSVLSHVVSSKTVFFPQDLDRYARTTRFSFALSAPATVSAVVRDATGAVVRTLLDAVPLGTGSQAVDWDGRLDSGGMAPRGTYSAVISATDGVLATTVGVAVVADPFRVTVNDTTPGRGQTITLYATSPELLKALPRVKVSQSGTSSFSVTMQRLSTYRYKVTIRLTPTGTSGTVRFSLSGTDASGGINRASRTFALH